MLTPLDTHHDLDHVHNRQALAALVLPLRDESLSDGFVPGVPLVQEMERECGTPALRTYHFSCARIYHRTPQVWALELCGKECEGQDIKGTTPEPW